jgi:hypothetical protein
VKEFENIYPVSGVSYFEQFEDCIKNLLEFINLNKINLKVIKISCFLNVETEELFWEFYKISIARFSTIFKEVLPVISIIPQAPIPFNCTLEICYLSIKNEIFSIYNQKYGDINYLKIIYEDREEIIISLTTPKEIQTNSLKEKSEEIFYKLESIINLEDFKISDIVRQWNFIGKITDFEISDSENIEDYKRFQNYQIFNNERAIFYSKNQWQNGYPAATGIGLDLDLLIIELILIKPIEGLQIIKLDNPNQIPAHNYSEEVLKGDVINKIEKKSCPKFERGKLLRLKNQHEIYISGTASIIGEKSFFENDIVNQTKLSIANINNVLNQPEIKKENKFQNIRVYIKDISEYPTISEICNYQYKNLNIIYLKADICRTELLVEIECYLNSD